MSRPGWQRVIRPTRHPLRTPGKSWWEGVPDVQLHSNGPYPGTPSHLHNNRKRIMARRDESAQMALAIVHNIAAHLHALQDFKKAIVARVRDLEREGWIVIQGGGQGDDRGSCEAVTHWGTENTLVEAHPSGETCTEERCVRDDPRWYHIDSVYETVHADQPHDRGLALMDLPTRLQDSIWEFACENQDELFPLIDHDKENHGA